MTYNKNHKIVLQAIIHEGAMEEDHGKQLIEKLFGHDNSAEVLHRINTKLQPLNMIIKYINCEITGLLYWVFANTAQDTSIRPQLEYSEVHLTLLRTIFSEIVTSDEGHVSSTWCLNLCPSSNINLSKNSAQMFLNDMVEKKWLFCKDGQYYIGVRSIAELSQYFKDSHEDKLRTCTLCKQTLFYGQKCEQCDAVIHLYCLSTYTKDQSNLRCPNCDHNIFNLDCSDDANNSPSDTEVSISKTKRPTRKRRKH
ncbi:PREDICTED: non-structural maintenance of chromosomes element 1 homolog isoform X2 [Dinoponera quadriceps]|uniref:Non-structural maintenance of chromosomes element 1 homolog n=1 Tax=Dinoponera quadriceps TaxID=609295 RepID=A0A6P3XP03_DINQU|nr:PREDICTED: non-structural maintenance of chromosomes element 1 homolog isoform X2 [Dinoponera quadriceps]